MQQTPLAWPAVVWRQSFSTSVDYDVRGGREMERFAGRWKHVEAQNVDGMAKAIGE